MLFLPVSALLAVILKVDQRLWGAIYGSYWGGFRCVNTALVIALH